MMMAEPALSLLYSFWQEDPVCIRRTIVVIISKPILFPPSHDSFTQAPVSLIQQSYPSFTAYPSDLLYHHSSPLHITTCHDLVCMIDALFSSISHDLPYDPSYDRMQIITLLPGYPVLGAAAQSYLTTFVA